jgi:putative Mg2+ transporter-C (MgtC) family protein
LGISFIGAGTILKASEESKVYYLTTAATVLFSAGIGIAVALEQYVLSITATVLLLIINRVAKTINKKV